MSELERKREKERERTVGRRVAQKQLSLSLTPLRDLAFGHPVALHSLQLKAHTHTHTSKMSHHPSPITARLQV